MLKGKILFRDDKHQTLDIQKELCFDPIIQLFQFEKIFNGCEKIVHENILSQSQKRKNKEMTLTLKRLEELLMQEVVIKKLDFN